MRVVESVVLPVMTAHPYGVLVIMRSTCIALSSGLRPNRASKSAHCVELLGHLSECTPL